MKAPACVAGGSNSQRSTHPIACPCFARKKVLMSGLMPFLEGTWGLSGQVVTTFPEDLGTFYLNFSQCNSFLVSNLNQGFEISVAHLETTAGKWSLKTVHFQFLKNTAL
jgi:hypothetical protein